MKSLKSEQPLYELTVHVLITPSPSNREGITCEQTDNQTERQTCKQDDPCTWCPGRPFRSGPYKHPPQPIPGLFLTRFVIKSTFIQSYAKVLNIPKKKSVDSASFYFQICKLPLLCNYSRICETEFPSCILQWFFFVNWSRNLILIYSYYIVFYGFHFPFLVHREGGIILYYTQKNHFNFQFCRIALISFSLT